MPRHPLVESLEARQFFAAVPIDAAVFYNACVAADTDGSLTLSAGEATAYAGVVKAGIKTATDANKAAVAQATRSSGDTLRSLAAENKTALAAATRPDRKAITTAYNAAVKTEKAGLKTELAGLKSAFAETLATSNATRAAFTALGKAFAKPFASEVDGDRQLDLHEGTQEFGALLARDDNGSSLSVKDLANLNRL